MAETYQNGTLLEMARPSPNSAWWCNVPLKNDGVKVNGVRMTSFFYEMENEIHV